jgi:hypothetical protein
MKKYLLLLLLSVSSAGFSQSVNDYKYAIVPSKFNFLKEKDAYRMNTLTKMFMEKYGFVTYFDTDILPTEIANQNCNKVFVDVISNGNMFMTKLTVVLKDCKNEILFTSTEGKSREKEYQVSYNQALREAFGSFDTLEYKYNGTVTGVETLIVKTTNDGSTIKQEVIPVNTPVTGVNSKNSTSLEGIVLFAQPISNGFQLVDNTPKVVMKIFRTSNKDCFIATKENTQGVLIAKDNQWFFEYYQNDKLISEKAEVKF